MNALARYWSADPQRVEDRIRAWAAAGDEAGDLGAEALLALGDPAHVAARIAVLRGGRRDDAALREYLVRRGAPDVSLDDSTVDREALFADDPLPAVRAALEAQPELAWIDNGSARPQWLLALLRKRIAERTAPTDRALGALACWPDPAARAEYWSIVRAGRHLWVYSAAQEHLTLGGDPKTLHHWARELESNCCRIGGQIEAMFEPVGADGLNADPGISAPPSERVRRLHDLLGGTMVAGPLGDGPVPLPE
jgi:hypothetical protein